jgi:dTDP-4-amino-4,6-dideoxygalactose transaminase
VANDLIPFVDLVNLHRELKPELTEVFERVLDTAGFIGGAMVESFERDFAAFCGTECSVAVNSGTDALRFALIAAGVRSGDVVLTVAHTFIATAEAISQAGATPEFLDIDESTFCLDAAALGHYLESCERDGSGRPLSRRHRRPITGVVPVHLYGQPAPMDEILAVAERHHLLVIEDACQAHGAEYFSRCKNRWLKCGSMGRAAAFSFYPGKNLGACGEGGAITTNDSELARTCKMLRDHGQARKYYHDLEGYNGRLDSVQCGILSVKLRRLPEWNRLRRRHAERYGELFAGVDGLVAPREPSWSRGVFHLYVIRVADRDGLQKHLAQAGIGTGIHYPIPLHEQKPYARLGYNPEDLPVTDRLAREILSLPMFPGLTAEQQERTAGSVIQFCDTAGTKTLTAASLS